MIEVSRQSRRRTAAEAHHETVVETYCTEVSACDAATGFVAHIITVALAAAAFFMWLAWCLKKPIVRKARHDPRGLVPAAGTIVGRVVGRTELCLVIMRAIRNRDSRRPHLLVDGVGTSKTAVLVQLTEMLAEYRAGAGADPLARCRNGLDSGEVAREQFCKEVEQKRPSGASDHGRGPQATLYREGRPLQTHVTGHFSS